MLRFFLFLEGSARLGSASWQRCGTSQAERGPSTVTMVTLTHHTGNSGKLLVQVIRWHLKQEDGAQVCREKRDRISCFFENRSNHIFLGRGGGFMSTYTCNLQSMYQSRLKLHFLLLLLHIKSVPLGKKTNQSQETECICPHTSTK